MRKIVNSTYISLDGVIERPQDWPSSDVGDDTGDTLQSELLFACDAVLMGRRTYESFAGVWSGRSGDPYTDQINSMDKYVVSSTLKAPEWVNTTVVNGDVVAEVERLKAQPGKGIVQYGFGPLAHLLLEHGLLDEVRLWVHPFFVRSGGPADLVFREGSLARFDLVGTTPLRSGIVILSYRSSP